MKICILDDDIHCIFCIENFIRKIGCKCDVETFFSPDLCLDHYKENEMPDLVLSDYSMPRMNGKEVINELRRMGFSGPAYFVTAWAEPDKSTIGLSGVVRKPIRLDDFKDILVDHAV